MSLLFQNSFEIKQTETPSHSQSGVRDFSHQNHTNNDFSGQDLRGCIFFRANLEGARFNGSNLTGAEFTGANLRHANFEEAIAESAGFGMANLEGANLFAANLKGATLTRANLSKADFRCANLEQAKFREANLERCDFTNAVLKSAELSLANVRKAQFHNADLRNARLRMLKNFDQANWLGVDIRNVHFAGAYRIRRFIVDQNYLIEFKQGSRLSSVVYFIWKITSNCGRSMSLWFLWILILCVFFGFLYMMVDVDYGRYPTWLSPFYYSLVTLTTLGYGDVVPKSLAGQMIAMAEVIIGYLMLGGLVSILSNKFARRGE